MIFELNSFIPLIAEWATHEPTSKRGRSREWARNHKRHEKHMKRMDKGYRRRQ